MPAPMSETLPMWSSNSDALEADLALDPLERGDGGGGVGLR